MQGNPIFMQQAIDLATANVTSGKGGPFGCVIVRNGEVIATGTNCVTSHNDPTAHAEVTAIRAACQKLASFQLADCEVYTSCEPCPMCMAALYWARVSAVYYGNTAADAASIGFDDDFLYQELKKPLGDRMLPIRPLLRKEAFASFAAWQNSSNKIDY
jgi:tRNA(Arg) A34 adenosine deaminase TadA